MEFSVNHPIIFVMVAVIILAVLGQSVFFLIRAIKRAKEKGMEMAKIKSTIISAAIFTIAPAISILVGVVALSKSLGIALPWLRLSVIGSLSYESIAAERALEALGLGTDITITAPEAFVTVAWVMTLGILIGLILTPILTKKIQSGMKTLEKKDKRWREIFQDAMFMGMISAFLGFVFCDVTLAFKGDFTGFIPVLVFFASAIVMAVLGILSKKNGFKWLKDYALPISLIVGMALAIPITSWLG
ncbi:MAG: DUF5058 family protein [Clostridia bacterium]|nr:DUF5058 family protein [Clostridia bacterium]